jgi:hypothetical protein
MMIGKVLGVDQGPPPAAADPRAQQAYALNQQGIAAEVAQNWHAAETDFSQALALSPSDPHIRRNLGISYGGEGYDAFNRGDYTSAIGVYRQSLAYLPPDDAKNIATVNSYIAAAQGKIAEAQRQQQDRVTAAQMQQSIQGLAQSFTAAPASGGLDFSNGSTQTASSPGLGFVHPGAHLHDAVADSSTGGDTTTGVFGEKVANPHLTSVRHRPAGPDASTSAGDQALAAAHSGDLTINYDVGGAQTAVHLRWPVANLRDHYIDPTAYSARELSDPRMISALNRLGDLKAERARMEAALARDRRAANTQTDPVKMKVLTEQADREERAYQGVVTQVFNQEATIKKVHRTIDATPATPAKSGN